MRGLDLPAVWLRRLLRRGSARLGALRYSRNQPLVAAVIHRFRGDDLSLRAGGLTYITIFSLVPLATVSFFLMSSLHQVEFQRRLHVFLQDVLGPGVLKGSGVLLDRFLTDTAARPLNWVSFLTLLVSGGSLLKSLDVSLNELWNVRRQRPWSTRLVLYVVAMTLGPLLLAISLSESWHARELLAVLHVPKGLLALSGVFAPVVALALLYTLAPNAPVRRMPALVGALVGGLGWSIARFAYATFAAKLFHYNVVYGSLGAAPLFLVWVYLSWLIVLFGARLAYALQHAAFRDTWPFYELHPRGRELLAARVAQELAQAWRDDGLPRSLETLGRRIRVPADSLASVLDGLEEDNLVMRVPGGFRAARDPQLLTLAQACSAVLENRRFLRVRSLRQPPAQLTVVAAALAESEESSTRKLREISWANLAEAAATGTYDAPPQQGSPKSIALTKT